MKRKSIITRTIIAILSVWFILWIVFFIRENKDGEYRDFFRMFGRPLEEQQAILLGDDLYKYVVFCKENVPSGSKYKFEGIKPFAIEEVRAMYYLSPLKGVEDNYEYIFVYKLDEYSENNFTKIAEFSKDSYILKRKK